MKAKKIVLLLVALAWIAMAGQEGRAQYHPNNAQYHRYYYYPYYYFPHNYWPAYSQPWPEPLGQPYMRPPAYMAYPPFLEPRWRYDLWQPQRHYRGFHFWLDQF